MGTPVAYRPHGGAPFTARGVFGDPPELIMLGDGVEVESSGPQLFVDLVDFDPEPARGDELDVAGGTYTVSDVDPDGDGGALLKLEVAA